MRALRARSSFGYSERPVLEPERTTTDKPAKLVSVGRFRNEIDANLGLIQLKGAGIDGFITADDCGGWGGDDMQLVEGVFLSVRQEDAEEAKRILTSEPKA